MKRIELNKSLFNEQHEVWQTAWLRKGDPIFLWQYALFNFLVMSPSYDAYQSMLVDVLTVPTDIPTEDKLTQL